MGKALPFRKGARHVPPHEAGGARAQQLLWTIALKSPLVPLRKRGHYAAIFAANNHLKGRIR
jgi:hypothetical protein